MSLINRMKSGYRYAKGLGAYLREPVTAAQARETVERGLATRVEAFLSTLEQQVYGNPRSPYFKLLKHAGIESEDIESLIADVGLEGTLERLYDSGVYLSQEEFKGRESVKRGSLEFKLGKEDFSDPSSEVIGPKRSSGTTGSRADLDTDFTHMTDSTIRRCLACLVVRDGRPMAAWDAKTLNAGLSLAKAGQPLEKHFTTDGFRWTAEGFRKAALTNFTLLAARLNGHATPRPEYAPRNNPLAVVKWLAEKTAAGTPALLDCPASMGTRACLFAAEHNFNIAGTLFFLHGEPYTQGKAAVLKSVGAEARVRYSMTEANMSLPCGNPADLDEVHFMSDRLALISRPKVTTSEAVVPGLVVTSLRPTNPSRVLINFETGDYAEVFHRDCGCLAGEMGFDTHLSGIRSYMKLTSEGIKFMGTRLYQLVEEVLPAKFGGGLGDYQLIEIEEEGLPRVSIVVSPRVGSIDEKAVIAATLENIKINHPAGGELMTEQWRQANTLRVVRQEPYEARAQKVPPLFVLQEGMAKVASPV